MSTEEWDNLRKECDLSSDDEVPALDLGGINELMSQMLGGVSNEQLESSPPLARATVGSAGYDLTSAIDVNILPGTTVMIDTGVTLNIPAGYYGQICTRSSYAMTSKTTSSSGIVYTNHSLFALAGVIDADYKNNIGVLLHNSSATQIFAIKKGDRIAQLILHKIYTFSNELPTLKDESFVHTGFGSTGMGETAG